MSKRKSAVEIALNRLESVLVAESTLLEDISTRTLAVLVNQGLARRLIEITDDGRRHLKELRGEIKKSARKAAKAT